MEAVVQDTSSISEKEWHEIEEFMKEWSKEVRIKQIKKRNEEFKKLVDSWKKANDVLFGKEKH